VDCAVPSFVVNKTGFMRLSPEGQNRSQNFSNVENNFQNDSTENSLFGLNHLHGQNESNKEQA
jgi:hypothetical protein